MEDKEKKGEKTIIDDDLVSFFDLLARYDFEDKQIEKSASKSCLHSLSSDNSSAKPA